MKRIIMESGAFILLLIAQTFVGYPVWAQENTQESKSIDIDKALETKVSANRAQSYYHFAIAKWQEEKGDLDKALVEMRNALKYNDGSAAVRVELAELLEKAGNTREAIEQAQEAAGLDPTDVQPHWLLANIYFKSQGRGAAAKESVKKAVKELEVIRDLAPTDERAYYALGDAYFQLGEPEKAIQAFEKFQDLMPSVNAGYMEIAKYYDKLGNQEKAIEYLKEAVKSQPDSQDALIYLASMLSKANQDKEAIPLYRKILEQGGGNPAVKRQLAISLIDAGEYEEAIKLLDELASAAPQDKQIQILLGRARLGSHQFAQAVEILKDVVDDNPDMVEAQFYLGVAYQQSGAPAEAEKIFAKLLDQTRGTSEEDKANRLIFQQNLAAVYQDMGENDKAIALYEDIVKNHATPNPRLYFLLINAYRVARQFDKALSVGKQQYEKYPSDTSIALVYARSLADAGKTKEGAEILVKILQADPSNVDAYVNLSQIYLQGKRYSDAEKVLRRAEERKLDSERVKFQLATVYERQRDFDRAEMLFREILKENPKNAIALNYIGYMLADRGVRLQEAVEYVKEALAIDPNNGAYLDSLGWAFFKLNDLPNAEKYLLQAVALVKNDPVIHDHLGDLYFKAGDLQKAQECWSKSLVAGGEPEDAQKVREKLEKLQEQLRKQKHP